jgi:hypothetical protein
MKYVKILSHGQLSIGKELHKPNFLLVDFGVQQNTHGRMNFTTSINMFLQHKYLCKLDKVFMALMSKNYGTMGFS